MTGGRVTANMKEMLINLKGCYLMDKEMEFKKLEYFLRPIHIYIILGFSILFITVVYATRENITFYLRDPAATFGFSPFAGLISNIGVFVLFSAGAISVFSFFQARQDRFLIFWVGLLSIFIAIDDFLCCMRMLSPGS